MPQLGEQLTLPPYLLSSNKASNITPYHRLIGTLRGTGIFLALDFAKPKSKNDCMENVIHIAVSVAAVTLATLLTGGASNILAPAVVAALLDTVVV